ncbi:Type IV pilus biogenesis factor PilY1 [bioreactor metagenome]|uniref:Type IV pilus biogenesis factor PilY1 n=1 Tax=bioreactor metagenome TaxID=1076179 RepID=A0A644ZQD2_9ZZZZ
MGYSVPQPTVARLNDAGGTPGKWVVLLPNGYQGLNSSAGNASMFVLDVSNGQVIRKFDLPGGMSTAEVTASKPLGNGLSRVAAIDNDSDGKVDLAYAGDLAGNVWRFDLTSGSSTAWTAQLFFTARDKATPSQRQPITAAPYVVKHPSGTGDLVIFGTGRFLASADKQSVQNQTVYGVWDRHSTKGTTAPATLPTANKGRSNLHQQTFTSLPDTSDPSKASGNFKLTGDAVTWYNSGSGTADANVAKWGWYVDLPRNGEKLVYDMSLYGKSLIFTTIRTAEDPCKADIAGTIYAIDPNDGGKTDYTAFDMNNDGKFDAADQQNDNDVNGAEIDPGKVTLGAGKAITPVGEGSLGVNDGLDRGRQSWRRQPS